MSGGKSEDEKNTRLNESEEESDLNLIEKRIEVSYCAWFT